MKKSIQILSALFLSVVFFASCSKENTAPVMKSENQIYEMSTPVFYKKGGVAGEQSDEIVRVNSRITNQQNTAVAGAEVHVFNAEQHTIMISDIEGLTTIETPGSGVYNYQIFNQGLIVVNEVIQIEQEDITRIDIIE